MSVLDKMLNDGIPVNWSTILIGWYGPSKFEKQLSISDVASYAANLIESDPEQPKEVLKLAGAQDGESEMVESSLRQLAAVENSDQDNELRKWRLYLLSELEPTLSNDPVAGLTALTEFWEKFDYPVDSPHVVQGRGDDQDPRQYYTEENFGALRMRHREWIRSEAEFLK